MNILESVASAAHSVLSNRMRSILTMLGIIIGIAAVIMITSIGQGFANSVSEVFEGFGAGAVSVSVRHNMPEPATRSDMLTMDSAAFLSTHPDVGSVTPINWSSGRVQLRNPAESDRINVVGTTESYMEIERLDIVFGRFLTEFDVERAAPVAVIDSRLAREIFGRTDVIGESIRATFWFGSVDLQVVGIYRVDEFAAMMSWGPTTVIIPMTYFQRIINTDGVVDQIFVNSTNIENLNQTASEINRLLSLKHGNEDRYNVSPLMGEIDMITDMLGMVTGFVALVAVIS